WEPEVETRTYTISDKDVLNGYVEVPSMIDAEGLEYGTQRIPLQSSATANSTISYTVIKGKNGSSGFTPSASRKVSASSGGGGNSGGGGGGGGGGGSKKPKKEKPIESKKDRYHDVNVKLSQIDEELEDIGRDQEKLFGKDLLNALNRELEILETSS
ncbi:MAG: hypothetical protein IIX57_04480, partial [Lachnospiraceae bacterium]|nr:hypothetical protein [Lachnospiraceae bacterium]